MPETKGAFREPLLADLVIYRSRVGIDIAALVTGRPELDVNERQFISAVFLTQFPPPGEAPDLTDRTWGIPYSEEPAPGTWRWPERA